MPTKQEGGMGDAESKTTPPWHNLAPLSPEQEQVMRLRLLLREVISAGASDQVEVHFQGWKERARKALS